MSDLMQKAATPAGRINQMRVSQKNDGYYYLDHLDEKLTGDQQLDETGEWIELTIPQGTLAIYDKRSEKPVRRKI